MSVVDIIESVAMTLLPLPTPKHGPNKDGMVVDLHFGNVTTYGNKATCKAQGLFFIFGITPAILFFLLFNVSKTLYQIFS